MVTENAPGRDPLLKRGMEIKNETPKSLSELDKGRQHKQNSNKGQRCAVGKARGDLSGRKVKPGGPGHPRNAQRSLVK